MSRRLVLGQQNDGTIGLRVSAPGVDAFVGDGQGGNFTFNSAWTDIAKIHAVGLCDWAIPVTFINPEGTTTSLYGFVGLWPNLGYKPFVEVRQRNGTVVYDDYMGSVNTSGAFCEILTDRVQLRTGSSSPGFQLLYIVYAIPVPSQ